MKVYAVTSVTNYDLYNLAMAGKRCYSFKSLSDLHSEVYSLPSDKINKFISSLISKGHLSILEHLNFTFAIEDVSRIMTHQLVRHRHFSFAQMSHRYTKNPKMISDSPLAGSKDVTNMEIDCIALYYKLIEDGTNPEDARYVLPGTLTTSIFVTGNLRTWIEFISKRTCMRAQHEINFFALGVHHYFMKHPVLGAIFKTESIGADCVTQRGCPSHCPSMFRDREEYLSMCNDGAFVLDF